MAYQVNPLQLLIYEVPVTMAAALVAGFAFGEAHGLMQFQFTQTVVLLIVLSVLLAIGVNISAYMILGKTSAVTYQVCLGAGVHWNGRGLRGGPRSGQAGGWRWLRKRLGAVTVGYKCH